MHMYLHNRRACCEAISNCDTCTGHKKKKEKRKKRVVQRKFRSFFPFLFRFLHFISTIYFSMVSQKWMYIYVYVYIAFQIFDRLMGGFFKMGEFYRTWLDFLRVNFLYNFSSRHIFNLLKSYYGPLFSIFFFFFFLAIQQHYIVNLISIQVIACIFHKILFLLSFFAIY